MYVDYISPNNSDIKYTYTRRCFIIFIHSYTSSKILYNMGKLQDCNDQLLW